MSVVGGEVSVVGGEVKCRPKWQNIADFSNLRIEARHTVLKPISWP